MSCEGMVESREGMVESREGVVDCRKGMVDFREGMVESCEGMMDPCNGRIDSCEGMVEQTSRARELRLSRDVVAPTAGWVCREKSDALCVGWAASSESTPAVRFASSTVN